ncbi:SDR family oxidoreductase [Chitinophagaceae bacterium MMS25-I14]
MRVFVTGATGFVGSAVVQELINAGHTVTGLARTDKAAEQLMAAGAQAHFGDLEDLESLKSGIKDADGVIHCGFIHDFSRFKEVCEVDRSVIMAMGEALKGTDRPLIVTSGTGVLSSIGRPVAETDKAVSDANPRVASEEAVDMLAAAGVRVGVLRLPPSTHGVGDHGFVPMLINVAREKGLAVYTGEGNNLWPAVHRLDAAKLYRLALESNFAPGTRFHAVADEGVPFRKIAEVIGKRLNIPVVSKSPEEAAEHFGWFAHFAAMDIPATSEQTRRQTGWSTTQPGLMEDIDQEAYFK